MGAPAPQLNYHRRVLHRLIPLIALCIACSDPTVGDPCDSDEDCADIHRDAICYDDGSSEFCTLACDIEESRCVRLEGTTCVEMETSYRPDAFAAMTCDNLGFACEMGTERSVCR